MPEEIISQFAKNQIELYFYYNGSKINKGIVEELIVEDNKIQGVISNTGAIYRAKSVVLTTGTAAKGEIII